MVLENEERVPASAMYFYYTITRFPDCITERFQKIALAHLP